MDQEDDDCYFVIANYSMLWLGKEYANAFNRKSGFSRDEFYDLFATFAGQNELEVRALLHDYAILKGQPNAYAKMQMEMGPIFSYAITTEYHVRLFEAAVGEALLEGGDDISELPDWTNIRLDPTANGPHLKN